MALPRTRPCPRCERPIPVKAKSCHHCGACDQTGWNEELTGEDGLDLPGGDFDYEKFTQEEFGEPPRPKGMKLMWKITAWVLVLLTVALIALGKLFN